MPISPSEIRSAAAKAISNLIRQQGDILHWSDIAEGFNVGGEKLLFANQARGIFKPKLLADDTALSIKSSRPSRPGRVVKYHDGVIEDGLLHYRLQGDDANNHDNNLLRQAQLRQLALIYFDGISDSVYQVFFPVFVEGFDPQRMEAILAWKPPLSGSSVEDLVLNDPHHLLGRRTATNRLHDARFRANIFSAYGFHCAFSHARIGSLLSAVRILPGAEAKGVPSVNNGICMSVLHQSAFDANLIGINDKLEVKVGRLLTDSKNLPLRDQLLGSLPHSGRITPPRSRASHPNTECLRLRFAQYEEAQN